MPEISVIIPAYNAAPFILETLDSVRSQTFSDWEAWVVDDESSDNIQEIIQPYLKKDPRIRFIQQKNTGQGGARNTGIKNCQGQFIALLDSDDLWLPDKLTKQWEIIQKYPEVDLVYTTALHFSDMKMRLDQPPKWHYGIWKGEELFQKLFIENGVPNSSLLIRKSAVEKVGLYDESDNLRGTEDWDLLLRLASNGFTFYGIDSPLIKYRIHTGGIHLNSIRMLQGKLAVLRKFDENTHIPNWKRVRNYRIFIRELMNQYARRDQYEQMKCSFQELKQKDTNGWVTKIQTLFINWLNPGVFHYLSQKLVYRIGFRMEHFSYPWK